MQNNKAIIIGLLAVYLSIGAIIGTAFNQFLIILTFVDGHGYTGSLLELMLEFASIIVSSLITGTIWPFLLPAGLVTSAGYIVVPLFILLIYLSIIVLNNTYYGEIDERLKYNIFILFCGTAFTYLIIGHLGVIPILSNLDLFYFLSPLVTVLVFAINFFLLYRIKEFTAFITLWNRRDFWEKTTLSLEWIIFLMTSSIVVSIPEARINGIIILSLFLFTLSFIGTITLYRFVIYFRKERETIKFGPDVS